MDERSLVHTRVEGKELSKQDEARARLHEAREKVQEREWARKSKLKEKEAKQKVKRLTRHINTLIQKGKVLHISM